MKKNLFFVIGSCLFALFSVSKTNAQVADQAPFKSVAPLAADIKKPASKVSADLNLLYKDHLYKSRKAQAKVKPVLSNAGLQKYIQIKGDYVLVDITVKEDNSKTRAELEKAGFKISAAYGRVISGKIPIENISQLEGLTNIKFARPAYKPMRNEFKSANNLMKWGIQGNSVKPVISQGDTAQHSNIARSKSKVNGKGVKVGILSDSYNSLGTDSMGVANGELPGPGNPFGFNTAVKVLEDLDPIYGGTDEGRGMAEIVHDVAPGAEIAFHTADYGLADFAQGILDLAKYGCKVITDDVIYFSEPFFQDGIVAQAVDDVKKDGVTYFSAAGNQSRQSYESKYQASNYAPLDALFDTAIGTAHNFSTAGNPPIYFQPIKIPTHSYVIFDFQWDDPFFSASVGGPGAESDLDIWLLDSKGNIVSYSAEDNIENGDPYEAFGYENDSTNTSFYLLITKFSGPDPAHLKYIFYGDASFGLTIPGIRAGTLVGHAKARGAIATAAAWWKQTPAYESDTPRIESYSSVGGVPNYFNAQGKRINRVERKKPEITAPDGGNTSFFGYDLTVSDSDTFPNFFGTSAAAPHAAGVAALMIEAQKLKTITPDQIKGVLEENAIDMNDRYKPGFETGFDFNTGYGFIQADKAVSAVKYPNIYIKDLKLEAVCSNNPTTTRNWKITNPNSFDVEAHWLLAGFAQADNIIVPPGEKTFSTNTAYYINFPVPNVVIIDWKDNLNKSHIDVAYSSSAKCGQEIVSEKNSDQRLSKPVDAQLTGKPNTIEVYPNPVTRNFKVYMSLTKPQKPEISLYSADGKVVYQKNGESNGVIDIDASNYKPGLYILKVRQGEFNKTFKVIKQ